MEKYITINFEEDITNAEKIDTIFQAFGLENINVYADMEDVFIDFVYDGFGLDSETVKWLAELLTGKLMRIGKYGHIIDTLNTSREYLKNGIYKVIKNGLECRLVIFDDFTVETITDEMVKL